MGAHRGIIKKCDYNECDKVFETAAYRLAKGRGRYCSHACRGKATLTGIKRSASTKAKMVEIGRERQNKLWASPFYQQQMSDAHTGKEGKLASNWRGGKTSQAKHIRNSQQYARWREQVFQRDDYTCQACGERGGKLHADHCLPFSLFPDLRLEVLNGRTLCEDCHKKTPSYAIKSKEQIAIYL